MNGAEYNGLISADDLPWSCLAHGEENDPLKELIQIEEREDTSGSIKVNLKMFMNEAYDVTVERLEINAGDNAAFILDKVSSQTPINLKTRFWVKGGKDLRCNVAEKSKLVFRNAGSAAKFFRLQYMADGNNILETAGLMLPDSFSETGDMGLTYYSGLHHVAKEHVVLYGICCDTEQSIAKWHFFNEKGFIVRPPSQTGGYRVILSECGILIEQLDGTMARVEVPLHIGD